MTDFLIRPYVEADIANMVAIEQSVQFSPWSATFFLEPLSLPRYWGCVLVCDGNITGFYVAEHVVDEVTLHNIAVAPEYQGKGYGRLLLDHAIQQAKERLSYQTFLEVRESNLPAKALYESMGFACAGVRKAYYSTANGRENALVMVLALS